MASFLGSGTALVESICGNSYDDDDECDSYSSSFHFYSHDLSDSNGNPSHDSSSHDHLNLSSSSIISHSDYHLILPSSFCDEDGRIHLPETFCNIPSKPIFYKSSPFNTPSSFSPSSKLACVDSVDCGICWCPADQDNGEELIVLGCGHKYCHFCLDTYCYDQSFDSKNTIHHRSKLDGSGAYGLKLEVWSVCGIICPEPNCVFVITDSILRKISPRFMDRISHAQLRLVMKKLVEIDEAAICPLRCGGYIQECRCSNEKCRENYENLKPYQKQAIIQKWADAERASGVMMQSWLKNNGARACPRCNQPIEKNGGCSLMHCTQCELRFNWNTTKLNFARRVGYTPHPLKK